ncbi:hypothetical protein PSN45_002013 [Yamadazyma tenuis]|uniref:BZIP domain-containing protein n=1 Tax=Candida tenuis (strain ATCC 10573 / BCRC 21748 / CBS 615 / JCM 9827 / NBRC 10315 / NRRL Y-1498 / VKM Y-70) TaxID=590646 RepID=G3BCY0_CANTC|nr:uncharacterized protein CANTEDRAFT_95690 [Yamadazyma tenuis ATCC 10573]EGV60235.1 hypothetical protein CANTEDRAFT_95690 [Yamadazyma tenuis ATCC 10573]WEJ94524.1 hypothetical protein PSN45_002013 [Yamadazyma tenuis]
MADDQDKTNKAILDQLVYIDNFIGEDHELNFDLSAFADDSFIFADEEKPPNDKINEMLRNKEGLHALSHGSASGEAAGHGDLGGLELNNLPRFPVPPGAKSSLEQAGLNQSQIDLLSALIAQYQSVQQAPSLDSVDPVDPQMVGMSAQPPRPRHNHRHSQSHTSRLPLLRTTSHGPGSASGSSSAGGGLGLSGDTAAPETFVPFFSTSPSLATGSFGDSAGTGTHDDGSGSESPASSSTSKSIDNDIDKRRRNTAASARFRIKKKLKEKQMEDKISNLQDVIRGFEGKIQTLELENRLLKNLIIEKGSEKSDNELRMLREKIYREEQK